MLRFAFFCAAFLYVSNANAEDGPYSKYTMYSARWYLSGCRDYLKQVSNTFSGRCVGLVEGLGVVAGHVYCAPPAPAGTTDEHIRIIVSYVEGHPERWDEDFRMLALEALRTVWPCGKNSN